MNTTFFKVNLYIYFFIDVLCYWSQAALRAQIGVLPEVGCHSHQVTGENAKTFAYLAAMAVKQTHRKVEKLETRLISRYGD